MNKKQLTLQRAIDGFLLAKQAEGKSKKTVDWYAYNLRQFTTWLARVPQANSISSIAAEHIREFLNYLREAHILFEGHRLKRKEKKCGVSQRSVRGAFATLSAFFNWALQERLVAISPTANMHRPKVAKTITPVFSREEMQALLKACDDSDDEAISARNKAMLMVLLDTGIRLSELLDIRTDRMNLTESHAQVAGKGAKDRYIYFGAQSKKLLWRYISLFRPQPMGITTQVFLNRDGSAMQARRFAFILTNMGRKASVGDVHPHRFRHTAAVQFLRLAQDSSVRSKDNFHHGASTDPAINFKECPNAGCTLSNTQHPHPATGMAPIKPTTIIF